MIDRSHIGRELAPSVLDVETGRLVFFAQAIGETDPVYTDETAARAAGYPALPAPPTFIFAAELDSRAVVSMLDAMGVPLARILHGEQAFRYLAPVCAGDTVTVRSRVADIYARRSGALEFIVKESTATNQHGTEVATMRSVIVVRNPPGAT
jgi:acyl dehydratase